MSLFHSKLSKAPYHHKDQSEPSFQWPTGRFKPSPSPPSDFSSYVIPHSFLSSLINFHAAPQACQAQSSSRLAHMLFPLPEIPFPQICVQLSPLHHSDLSSNVTMSESLPVTALSQ